MADQDATRDRLVDAEAEFERLWRTYQLSGSVQRAGFGERPAVVALVPDAGSPAAATLAGDAAGPVRAVLGAARGATAPVIVVASAPAATAPPPAESNGGRGLDGGLGPAAGDETVVKPAASAFFGTDLVRRLVSRHVDTVLIVGAPTSGCIRATAVDAAQHGFLVAVVQDAVADPERLPHLASLFDLGTRYADLVTAREAVTYLAQRRDPREG